MRQVLPIAGAIVGAYFGNPQLGFAIGSLIGNVVDPQEIQGSKVGDNPMQTASEGGARAIVFGTGCVRATCLLERGNRQIVEVEDQAGKGGPVTVNERVYWTFAIGLGEAIPGGAIIRIWEGEKLVYDASPESTIPAETAEFARKFRFYDGSEDQLPDPALEAINGVGNTHYYRGTAYVVFPNYDLTDYREQIPVFRWEIASSADVVLPTNVLALRITSGVRNWRKSDQGVDWPGGWNPGGAGISNQLASNEDRFFSWDIAQPHVSYLETSEDGWQSAGGDGVGETGGARLGWADGDHVGIGGANGVTHSSDRGLIFTRSGPATDVCFKAGSSWVAIRASTRQIYLGGTPGSLALHDDLFPNVGSLPTFNAVHCFNGMAMLGGRASSQPFVAVTNNGRNYTITPLDVDPTSTIAAIAAGMVGNEETWLVCTDAGEMRAYTAAGWQSVGNFGARIGGCAWNGQYFLVSGGNSAYDDNGFIRTSTDLVNWTTRYTDSLPAFSVFGNISAKKPRPAEAVGNKIPLGTILTALHLRAGHTPGDFDVSECAEMVTGIVFESSVTFAEAINSVIGSYFKDPSEYDRKIRYISRGKAVVRTLTEDDLVDEPETSRRENAIEYPRKLHYFFQSPITHYAATKATSARSSPDVHVIGEVSISSPITYDNPDEPAQVSAKLHKVYWSDAEGEIVWHVTDEHADLVPGDCVGLNLRGVIRRARITSIEDDPGVRKLTMRIDRQSAYTSNVTGIPLPPPTPPRPSIIAPSVGLTMDIPALTDDADDLHYLRAVFGVTDVWAGAIDQRSMDGGASFASINTASRAAVVGVLQDTVTAASPHFTDTTNRVAVDLFVDRDLESISQQQFLSEGGAFALSYMDGGVRKWELCQYRDAEQDSDGNWILTTLHRGLLNTAAAAHAIGDYFVLIDRAILKNNAQSAWLGQELVHRAVSNGLSPETAATETTTYSGQSQTEWPVASVGLELDGDDLAVSIVPRHRFGTDAHPVRSLNWTGYRITATDGANSETYETTSDEAVIDVSGWSGTIDVTVAQINRITGPGPAISESIAA